MVKSHALARPLHIDRDMTRKQKIETATGMDMDELGFYATILAMSLGFLAGIIVIYA